MDFSTLSRQQILFFVQTWRLKLSSTLVKGHSSTCVNITARSASSASLLHPRARMFAIAVCAMVDARAWSPATVSAKALTHRGTRSLSYEKNPCELCTQPIPSHQRPPLPWLACCTSPALCAGRVAVQSVFRQPLCLAGSSKHGAPFSDGSESWKLRRTRGQICRYRDARQDNFVPGLVCICVGNKVKYARFRCRVCTVSE